MNKPLISIVIPTRNRPDTLEICLRAMRRHTSQAIEIVVQDNCSEPATFDVVSAAMALDPRIRYSKSPAPSSQRQNFEYGLAAATGDYLSIIGDDDGYSIGSLDWLVERLQRTPVDAVRWNLLHYIWPSLSEDGEGFMDYHAPMVGGGSSVEDGAEMASRIIETRLNGSWENILIYHGMISRGVYERMKTVTGGTFFAYPLPDVYAHNLIAFFCKNYLQVNDIVSIYGISGHSAGASWARTSSKDGNVAKEGSKWSLEAQSDPIAAKTYWQPEIKTFRYHDFAVFKIAEKYDALAAYTLDQDLWIKASIAEIKMHPFQIKYWENMSFKAPYDEIFYKKLIPLKDVPNANTFEHSNKKTFNQKLPSVRIKHVDAKLKDDIEGAMMALDKIAGSGANRFDNPVKKMSTIASVVYHAANYGRKIAPGLSSRIFNSRFMPVWLWRYLKTTQWGTKN